MKKIYSGTSALPVVQCINKNLGKYIVLCECTEIESEQGNEYTYQQAEFAHKPTLEEIKNVILSYVDSKTDEKILTGFVWQGNSVWLSSESQFNYKAAYDLAVQTNGANLPVTFKFGTIDHPVYHQFTSVSELSDFFTKAMAYINQCLAEGWTEKDSYDWTPYEELLQNIVEE